MGHVLSTYIGLSISSQIYSSPRAIQAKNDRYRNVCLHCHTCSIKIPFVSNKRDVHFQDCSSHCIAILFRSNWFLPQVFYTSKLAITSLVMILAGGKSIKCVFFGVCIVCKKTVSSLHINASLTSSISGGETFDKLPRWKLQATPFANDILAPLNWAAKSQFSHYMMIKWGNSSSVRNVIN